MSLDNPELRVRCLPEGAWHQGYHRGLLGKILRVEFADSQVSGFQDGCLVEVNWEETTYLGQTYNLEGRVLVIGVEHAVNRAPLSALQATWRGSRGK